MEKVKQTKSLLIIELRSYDPQRDYYNELLPFIQGFAKEKKINAKWFLYAVSLPEKPAPFDPDACARDLFIKKIEEHKATHILFNMAVSGSFSEYMKQNYPHIRVMCIADLPAEITGSPAAMNANAVQGRKWLSDFLGIHDDLRILLTDFNPDYSLESGNNAASEFEQYVKILDIRKICPDFSADSMDFAIKQICEVFKSSPQFKSPVQLIIGDHEIFREIEKFSDRLVSLKIPPSNFFFTLSMKELEEKLDIIEKILPVLKESNLGFCLYNVPVLNFSQSELDRLKSSLKATNLIRFFKRLVNLSGSYRGTFSYKKPEAFSFILFTPWTTVSDLETNIRWTERFYMEISLNFLRSRLRIFQGDHFHDLAVKEGLVTESFSDICFEAAEDEVPWKFKNPEVEFIFKILSRLMSRPFESQSQYDIYKARIHRWFESLSEKDRDIKFIISKFLKIMKKEREQRTIEYILMKIARSLNKHMKYKLKKQEDSAGNKTWEREQYIKSSLMRRVKSILTKGLVFNGFSMQEIEPVNRKELNVTLKKGDVLLQIIIENRKNADRYFAATGKFAISHRQDSPLDTEEKISAVRILTEYIKKNELK
jgi:hypothetical protein